MDVKVRVVRGYKDLQLNKMVEANHTMVVSRERADVLSVKGLVEVVESYEQVETNKLEPVVEKAVKKITTKKKPSTKKKTTKKK